MTRAVCVSRLAVLLLGFAFPSLVSVRASAQPNGQGPGNAALSGVVHDSSGAVVPRATIVVRQVDAGFERIVASGLDGAFVLDRLPSGRYLITALAPRFGAANEQVDVPLTQPLRITLAPAPIVEQVSVVSASRQEELRESLNTRVDVVTRSRIDETGGQETVAEVLREIPGVVTRRGSETAGPAGQQIQGIESRQVLVLLDGQPIVGARGIKRGGVINLDRQSTARLERVEVVKGAASALYGSDALGGVINMISREPSTPFDINLAVSGGSHGTMGLRVDSGFRRDRTFGVFSLERHSHDGFDLTPSTFDTTGAPYRRYDLLGKVERQLTPSFTVTGLVTAYHNDTGGRSNGELGPQEDDLRDRALSVNVGGSWTAGTATTVELRGYVSTFSEDSSGRLAPPRSTPLTPGSLDEEVQKVDATVSHAIGSRHLLQAGTEWALDRYRGANRVRDEAEGHQANTAVAWAQHMWNATSRLTTTVGARVDRRSQFETAVSPKLAASVRVTESLRARASYGRGFRAPDLGQLYYRFLSPSNFYQVIGNPALEPEFADSWQVGGEFVSSGRRARVGLNVFRNDVRDLIDSVSLGFIVTPGQLAEVLAREGLDPSFRPALGRLLLTYRNVADVVTQGIEVDVETALRRELLVGGAYTFLSARDAATDLPLTGRHRHHGHVRFSWQPMSIGLRASLRGTFFGSWIAARSTDSDGRIQDTVAPRFALWDLFLSQHLGRGLSAFLTIDNLAASQDPNTGVLLPTGSPSPIYRPEVGRTARIGVQWSLAPWK